MGDLVKNERTLLTSGSTNRKTGWKSFQIQQTIRLTFSFDTRLHQLLVGKFSPTWNILQPPEPQDAHSKGPKSLKKDSHHGKNKSLENRYIKICSSSICIPDINLPTLKIASFFLTAGVNPSEKSSSDWIMHPKFRRKNSNLYLFNHHLHKRFFQAT